MSNFKSHIEIMQQVSNLIRDAQNKMRELCLLAPAEFETLKWEKLDKTYYITYEGKHLVGCPFDIRKDNFHRLPMLIEAAKKATMEKFESIDKKAIQEISDFILDI